ncbi:MULTISPECIES: LysE family translocator [unclassified Roseobacter]|uniref:LysE family translocator n=1 Tax=unclassified Roseobacter TaxID=196798 RepID=UPI001492026B|nr:MULTISPECIES: LysE family transporter [unclassified Roseobacter]NOA91008.1 LysE family transporter [Roseobacter sp. HKCCD7561]NOC73927.1 LysE family transporter [Roseobacter sp. HKCCD7372]
MSELLIYLPGLLAAWAIQIASALIPGPVVMAILSFGADGARRQAFRVALGTASSASLLALVTAFGLASLVATFGWGMTILRWIGVLVLLWLAYRAFRRAATAPCQTASTTQSERPFATGFFLGASSPKALAYWMAIAAVAFTTPPPLAVIICFAVGAFLVSLTIHSFWALALSANPVQMGYAKARRWIEGTLGVFFTFAAFKLATSRS